MNKYSREDILRIVREEDVEFICLQFTDLFGIMKSVTITAGQVEKALDNRCMFDGSATQGYVRLQESDMYLYPDTDTFEIFHWRWIFWNVWDSIILFITISWSTKPMCASGWFIRAMKEWKRCIPMYRNFRWMS